MTEMFPNVDPSHETSDILRSEVGRLAETVLHALELADEIEVNDVTRSQSLVNLNAGPDITRHFDDESIPLILRPYINQETDWSLSVTFSSQFAEERPALSVEFYRYGAGITPYLFGAVARSGSSTEKDTSFVGSIIPDEHKDTEYRVDLSNDEMSLLLQECIRLDGVHISDQGTAQMRLLQELILDPQYPPIARFIEDTLAERGAVVNRNQAYSLMVDDIEYTLRILTEEGTTTQIEIVQPLIDEISVGQDSEFIELVQHTGARISHNNFNQAVEFFKLINGEEQAIQNPDQGDLFRIRETIDYLRNHLRTH